MKKENALVGRSTAGGGAQGRAWGIGYGRAPSGRIEKNGLMAGGHSGLEVATISPMTCTIRKRRRRTPA